MREVPLVPERRAGTKPSGAALQAARRLVARECDRPGISGAGLDQAAEALYRGCDRVIRNLRESIGDDGCDALFGRAMARSEAFHPVLTQLRDLREPGISRAHLSEAVQADAAGARAAVEALLGALIEILARLIGEDMALRIIDHDATHDSPPSGASGAAS